MPGGGWMVQPTVPRFRLLDPVSVEAEERMVALCVDKGWGSKKQSACLKALRACPPETPCNDA